MSDQARRFDLKARARPNIGLIIFLCAICVGFLIVLGKAWATHKPPIEIKPLFPDVSVTGQLQLQDIKGLEGRFATVIDLRPDGEAAGQPSSQNVGSYCKAFGIKFAYVPVQHGTIPDKSVRALEKAIEASPKPMLLYCRSGKRAVRTYCLAEASRADGASLETILSAAHSVGQSADDLMAELKSRIAHRSTTTERAP